MSENDGFLPPSISALRDHLDGHLIHRSHPDFDQARKIWNATADRRPLAVVRCTSVEDIRRTIDGTLTAGLPLVIRGGGHSIAGFSVCDDGIVVDIGPLNSVQVDPKARIARVQGGTRWGALDRAAQAFGLATTGGMISTTGVAGLTLGGGLGYLMRRHGLSCDNVNRFTLLRADGQLVTATDETEPELTWALRGGGGNFGVVTEIEFRLHPTGPMVPAGVVSYPISDAARLLRHFAAVTPQAPDDLCSYFMISAGDEANEPSAAVVMLWLGDPLLADAQFAPYRGFGSPTADTVGSMAYVDLQSGFDSSSPSGRRNYWKSVLLDELSEGFIESLVEGVRSKPAPRGSGPRGGVIIEQLGGAVARHSDDETAFGSRGAAYSLELISVWDDRNEDDVHRSWTRGMWESLRSYGRDEVYVNFMDGDDASRIGEAYAGDRLARLQAVKAFHDPDNVFWSNHNIAPSTGNLIRRSALSPE